MGLWDSISGAGQSLMGGLGSVGQGLMGMFGGGGKASGNNDYLGNMGNMMSGMKGFSPGQSTGSLQGSQAMSGFGGAAQQGGLGGLFKNLFQQQGGQGGMNPGMMGAGIGAMGLGQMMNPAMHVPNYGSDPNVQALQNWQNQPNHPMDPNVQQSVQNSLNQQNEISRRNLMNTYKNMRPGYSPTDSDFTRDTAYNERNIQMNNADAMAQAQFQSNNQQLGNLGNLANLGVGGQMQQLAMDAARRQSQNQMFGNVGSMFLQRGLGLNGLMGGFNPNYYSMGGQGRQ